MHDETELLVQAIESLRQETNNFKDYMFPLVSGFFSSLLGAGAAYLTLRYQDNSSIQKERINTINDWMLSAEEAMQSLISIKSNYHGALTDNPFQRTMKIRSLINSTNKINKDLTALSFIIPKKEKTEEHNIKWRQLPRIRAMIHNYNFIIELWRKRSEIERPIKEKIISDHTGLAFTDVTREQIISSVGEAKFTVLIDLTEKAIKYTDDLIIEFNDFITNFPEIGISLIDKKYRERYGRIITFQTKDNQKLLSIIEKTVEVDYTILSTLFGESVENIRKEYETGYE